MTADQQAVVGELLDQAWRFYLERSPVLQLGQGMAVSSIPGFGEDESHRWASFAGGVLERLDGVDPGALDDRMRVSACVLRHAMREHVDADRYYWDALAVTPYRLILGLGAVHPVFPGHTFSQAADVERYLGLVRDYAKVIGSLREKTAGQAGRGVRVAQPAIPGVVTSLERARGQAAGRLRVSPDRIAGLSPTAARQLADGIEDLLRTEVEPAFDSLLQVFDDEYAAAAPAEVGAGRVSEEYYRYRVRQETTLAHTPEDLHRIGLEQTELLAGQMAAVRERIGFRGSEDQFRARLRDEPRLYARSPEEVEARYRGYLDLIEPRLPELFRTLPRAEYGIRRLDPSLEGSMTFGFYAPPSRTHPVGLYHYNGSGLADRSLLSAAALIARELVPGAHLQVGRQMEDMSLPPLRREAVSFLAFVEAWADYGSALGHEIGLYEDPYDHYGWLATQRFTSARLVVDTGMNLLGWTLEQGREFMRRNTMEAEPQIVSETLRYSTDLPGQALGYRAGYMALAGYREHAEQSLGERFDQRDFHELVLGNGALPLDLLGEEVSRWEASR